MRREFLIVCVVMLSFFCKADGLQCMTSSSLCVDNIVFIDYASQKQVYVLNDMRTGSTEKLYDVLANKLVDSETKSPVISIILDTRLPFKVALDVSALCSKIGYKPEIYLGDRKNKWYSKIEIGKSIIATRIEANADNDKAN